MTTIIIVLLAVVAALSVVLLVLQLRRHEDMDLMLLQQQLVELRTRLDSVVQAQQQVPLALAEGSAAQARSLGEVREQLVRLSEATSRLEAMGEAVAGVQELLRVPRLRGTLPSSGSANCYDRSSRQRAYELVGKHLGYALKQYDETGRSLGLIQRKFDRIGSVGGESDTAGEIPP